MGNEMDLLFSVCVGVGLAAACGFRVFVPLLVMAIAANSGHLQLGESFAWIGTPAAIGVFGVATLLEVGAYYVPWVDNMLDSVATPAAVIAGTLATGAMVSDMDPLLAWATAIIAGGGTAATVQLGTVVTRTASTALTGGLTNPVVSTAEAGGSVVMSILAIAVPVLAVAMFATLAVFGVYKLRQVRRRLAATPAAEAARAEVRVEPDVKPLDTEPVRILDVRVRGVDAA